MAKNMKAIWSYRRGLLDDTGYDIGKGNSLWSSMAPLQLLLLYLSA